MSDITEIHFDHKGWCWDLSKAPKDGGKLKALVTSPFFGMLTPTVMIGSYSYEECDDNDEGIYQWYLGNEYYKGVFQDSEVLAWGYVEEPIYDLMPDNAKEKLKVLVRRNIPDNYCDDLEKEFEQRLAGTMRGFANHE